MNAVEIPQSDLDRLDPEYRAFILSSGTLLPPIHKSQWSPAFREAVSTIDFGSTGPVEVGSTRTIQLGESSLRVMTPPGEKPSRGWPVLLNMHAGGWVLGTAEMDDDILSKLCVDVKCMTVSVDYRLAPEHPFPAGLNDSWDALVWISNEGEREIGIDPNVVSGWSTSMRLSLRLHEQQRRLYDEGKGVSDSCKVKSSTQSDEGMARENDLKA